MVRLSSIAIGLLYGLSNTLGVVADSAVVSDPSLDGTVVVGFPSVNMTEVLAQAENQLGVNGTVTDNLPADYSTPGTTLKARGLEGVQKLRKRGISKTLLGTIACTALYIAFPGKVGLEGSTNYNNWNNPSFWSSTTYMTPTCVFKPSNANDISLAIRLIVLCQSDFNVVGGGHSAIKGWANVDDGVLIILSALTGVKVTAATKTAQGYAQVGVGERWGSTFTALDNAKVAALGGRMATVGVSGLVLGGGISYLTNKWGFVADQVKNFEVVLSNGCIVNANSGTNSDLFRALKGGSSNFGIVTRIDLFTWPSPGVYSGQLTFSDPNDFSKLFTAIYNYHLTGAYQDVETHLISAFVYVGAYQMHLGAFTVFKNTTIANAGSALQPILDVNPAVTNASTLQLRSYGSQAIELGSGDVTGLRQDMRDFSAYITPTLYKALWDLWNDNIVQKFKGTAGFMGTIAFQPITTNAVKAGTATGGNSLGLENNTGTMLIINLTHQWSDATADAALLAALDSVLTAMINKAKDLGVYHPYYYLNYARKQDNPIGSYGTTSVNRLKAVSKAYDSCGVFESLVPGGFKIPS